MTSVQPPRRRIVTATRRQRPRTDQLPSVPGTEARPPTDRGAGAPEVVAYSIVISDSRDQAARSKGSARKRDTNKKRHRKGGAANENPDMHPFLWETTHRWDGSPIRPDASSPDVRAIYQKCKELMLQKVETNGSGFPCSGDGCAAQDSRECAPCALQGASMPDGSSLLETSLLVFPYCGSPQCLAKISAAQQAATAASEPFKLDLLKMILGQQGGPGGQAASQEDILRAAMAMASGTAPVRMTPSLPSGGCAGCGTRAAFICKRCGTRYYCSKKCQTDAWPLHKQECVPRAG